jgi:serine/threonine protein kinase
MKVFDRSSKDLTEMNFYDVKEFVTIYRGKLKDKRVYMKCYSKKCLDIGTREIAFNLFVNHYLPEISPKFLGIIKDSSPLMIFEDGGTPLKIHISKNPDSLFYMLCKSIECLYKLNCLGISHNDLKPSNILVNSQGEIQFIDYGISEIICFAPKNNDCSIYSTTSIISSPDNFYHHIIQSPYLINSKYRMLHINRKNYSTDIYALGQSFLKLLFGFDIFSTFVILDQKIYSYTKELPSLIIRNRETIDHIHPKLFELFKNMIHDNSIYRYTAANCIEFISSFNLQLSVNSSIIQNITDLSIRREDAKNYGNYFYRYSAADICYSYHEISMIPNICSKYEKICFLAVTKEAESTKIYNAINWLLYLKRSKKLNIANVINVIAMLRYCSSTFSEISSEKYQGISSILLYINSCIYDVTSAESTEFMKLGNIDSLEFEHYYLKIIEDDKIFTILPFSIFIEHVVITFQNRGYDRDYIEFIEKLLFRKITIWVIFSSNPEMFTIKELIEYFLSEYHHSVYDIPVSLEIAPMMLQLYKKQESVNSYSEICKIFYT